ncbi:MAG: NUDIX hydrolase [Methylacidiphilales bacterium]|nr:NUDIX hydrolase [Candidatus Methylacidiphilales bacterium]
MKYCSSCGSDAMVFEIPAHDTKERYICKKCNTIYYTNPKIVVGCIIQCHEQILLCERNIEPRKGFLTYPAGFMENYETLQEACIRETREEAGVNIQNPRLFALYNLPTSNQIFVVYHHYVSDTKTEEYCDETASLSWVNLNEIPFNQLAFPIIVETLKSLIEGKKTPIQGTISRKGNTYQHWIID